MEKLNVDEEPPEVTPITTNFDYSKVIELVEDDDDMTIPVCRMNRSSREESEVIVVHNSDSEPEEDPLNLCNLTPEDPDRVTLVHVIEIEEDQLIGGEYPASFSPTPLTSVEVPVHDLTMTSPTSPSYSASTLVLSPRSTTTTTTTPVEFSPPLMSQNTSQAMDQSEKFEHQSWRDHAVNLSPFAADRSRPIKVSQPKPLPRSPRRTRRLRSRRARASSSSSQSSSRSRTRSRSPRKRAPSSSSSSSETSTSESTSGCRPRRPATPYRPSSRLSVSSLEIEIISD